MRSWTHDQAEVFGLWSEVLLGMLETEANHIGQCSSFSPPTVQSGCILNNVHTIASREVTPPSVHIVFKECAEEPRQSPLANDRFDMMSIY